jgi:lycopene beta-cyclase
MENKPVIILGGGLWGSLLAYRLKSCHPAVDFLLYEKEIHLGGNHVWSFHESDIPRESLGWLSPFIVKKWSGHSVHFPDYSKNFHSSFYSITSERLNEVLMDSIQESLRLGRATPLDHALAEASFVIDARNLRYVMSKGYQKFFGIDLELCEDHYLKNPVLMEATVEQKDGYRFLSYLPWSPRKVLIEDTRYSRNPGVDHDEFREDILRAVNERGWSVKRVLREEHGSIPIPTTMRDYSDPHRVVGVSGIFQDSTGRSLPDAVRLIDRMMKVSFRYGEIKEVVKSYREEREEHRRYFRFLNRLMFEASLDDERFKFFQNFYRLPEGLIQRFYRGELSLGDRARIFLGRSPVPLFKAIQSIIPEAQRVVS